MANLTVAGCYVCRKIASTKTRSVVSARCVRREASANVKSRASRHSRGAIIPQMYRVEGDSGFLSGFGVGGFDDVIW